MAAEKVEPDRGSMEETTSSLPFFSSDAILVIACNQIVSKNRNAYSSFEKSMGLKHRSEANYSAVCCERRLLLSRC